MIAAIGITMTGTTAKHATTSDGGTTILITEWNSDGTLGAGRKNIGDGGTIIGTTAKASSTRRIA
jgi:hypothetical protein